MACPNRTIRRSIQNLMQAVAATPVSRWLTIQVTGSPDSERFVEVEEGVWMLKGDEQEWRKDQESK